MAKLFQFTPLFSFLLCSLTACNNDDDVRLSPIQETTMEGKASTLQIDLTRGDWRIASVTDLDGYPPVGSGTQQLEGVGTLYYGWATIHRDKENTLAIEAEDNFDGKERGFIINLEMRTGFYKERIIIHQKQCTSFYQIESIVYSVEKGDGVTEAETQPWGMTILNYTGHNGESRKTNVWPFYDANIIYSFLLSGTGSPFQWIDREKGIYVDMPKGLSNGNIVYETEQQKYGNWQVYSSDLKKKSFEVDQVNQKQNAYSADIYYKQLELSYTLTLSRPGSDTKKVFKGILTKEYPYDCSPIRLEVSDLPEKGK